MSVGWIDNIYNNSKTTWYVKSVDDRHNGALAADGKQFTLDDGAFHQMEGETHFHAEWCGIPWYYQGKHYKAISTDGKGGVQFYTSELEGRNWVIYEELNKGRQLARQSVPTRSDFHCNLRFETEGVFLDVVNNNAFSGENAVYQVMSETKEWVKVLAPIISAAIKGAA